MRYKVIEIYYNKWRIYDLKNDLVYPKNFSTKQNAQKYILTKLAGEATTFHKVKTILDF